MTTNRVFLFQVADLARMNHENTGRLLGYCRESSPFTRMLVFEYASNGTLHEHLHCKLILPMHFVNNTLHCNSLHELKDDLYDHLQMEKDASFLGHDA